MASTSTNPFTARQLIFSAVQANTKHQYALEKYTERLAAELQEIDKLLSVADVEGSDDELEGDVEIPGAERAAGPVPSTDFLNPASPFYQEAIKRSRYINFTNIHPMKQKELDTLTEAVTSEFRRLKAIDYKERGLGIPKAKEPVDLSADVGSLNWKTIAEKVSDVSNFTRTASECKTKWLGYKRPGINHSEWKASELSELKRIVEERQNNDTVNWTEIAAELGTNRTPIDCMRNGTTRARHIWTAELDKKLTEGVQIYGIDNWALVALHISENALPSQCQMRYMRSVDPSLKKSAWTKEEDERLLAVVSALGPAWVEVAKHMPGRNNENCRDRYTDHLNVPNVRGGVSWTDEEDKRLVELVEELGNKWKKIGELLGNKHTGPQCKSRHDRLKKDAAAADASASGASSVASTPAPESALMKGAASNVSDSVPPAASTEPIGPAPQPASQSVAATRTSPKHAHEPAPAKSRPKPKPRPRKSTKPDAPPQTETNEPDPSRSQDGIPPSQSTTAVGVASTSAHEVVDSQTSDMQNGNSNKDTLTATAEGPQGSNSAQRRVRGWRESEVVTPARSSPKKRARGRTTTGSSGNASSTPSTPARRSARLSGKS